jgi:hypothetical protein
MLQNIFAAKFNAAAKVTTKSCKDLVPNNQYAILKMEKYESKFSKEKILVATVKDVSGSVRVYLPPRVKASIYTDEDIEDYNNKGVPTAALVFKGMLGRAFDVEIIPVSHE